MKFWAYLRRYDEEDVCSYVVRSGKIFQVPDRTPDWEVEALTTLLYLSYKVQGRTTYHVPTARHRTQQGISGPAHK